MTTTICPTEQRANSDSWTGAAIRRRITQINRGWSPQERLRRASKGRARRQELLTLLGLDSQSVCA